MVFDYVESWLTNPTAIPLSQSLPLTKKHFTRNNRDTSLVPQSLVRGRYATNATVGQLAEVT